MSETTLRDILVAIRDANESFDVSLETLKGLFDDCEDDYDDDLDWN